MAEPDVQLHGVVAEFDDARGLGAIRADDVVYSFHCVSIADGSRTIAVGTPVVFQILLKLGRREATAIRPA